jgi:hypothetical protein
MNAGMAVAVLMIVPVPELSNSTGLYSRGDTGRIKPPVKFTRFKCIIPVRKEK